MASKGFNKFIPAFIPLVFELMRHFRRDMNHNNNIRKTDKTGEKIANIEHFMVRLEKKIQQNRDTYMAIANRLTIWLFANSVILIAILVKLLFF